MLKIQALTVKTSDCGGPKLCVWSILSTQPF